MMLLETSFERALEFHPLAASAAAGTLGEIAQGRLVACQQRTDIAIPDVPKTSDSTLASLILADSSNF